MLRSSRLIVTASPEHVAQLEYSAQSSSLAPVRSLRQYWRVDAQGMDFDTAGQKQLASDLRKVPGVSTANVETPLMLPAEVNPDDDPNFGEQFHLRPPPDGVDAEYLWSLGYDGSGIGFVDIEGGWYIDHLDLPANRIETIPGDTMKPSSMQHGTSVLGVVAAVDNALWVVGVAPGVTRVTLSSVYHRAEGIGVKYLADAIVNAIDHSMPGDVILIEWQKAEKEGFLPVEVVDEAYDAIRLASALGRIVIEPAGNQGLHLDDILRDEGFVLRRGSRESGAVMVAASEVGPGLKPRLDSNHGTRVDCFAPGTSIVTCDYVSEEVGNAKSDYRTNFAQTSAASSIVAGAAVLFQSAWKARTGAPLSPLQLRARFSDSTLNTKQGTSMHVIGRMPNLRKLIDVGLPDVYLRDTVLDDGLVPSTGVASMSPDIIVRQAPVADPAATFGEFSGTAGDVALSQAVLVGRPHYIYTRLKNRGGVDAPASKVTVYWSPLATLITPKDWHLIGDTPTFDVPVGNTLAVSPALTWRSEHGPGSGHYCFIGLASQAQDLTLFPGPLAWNRFLELVKGNNNIAWRNFNVIDPLLEAVGDWIHLPFLLRGAPDRARVFSVQVDVHSVHASLLWLDMPEMAVAQFCDASPHLVDANDVAQQLTGAPFAPADDAMMIDLANEPGLEKRSILLDCNAEHRCALRIRLPLEHSETMARITFRQFFDDVEVGRLTWSFVQA
ncbi:MAG: S8 family serine peptidase [bacterium]